MIAKQLIALKRRNIISDKYNLSLLMNKEQQVQVSDTTVLNRIKTAGFKKIKINTPLGFEEWM